MSYFSRTYEINFGHIDNRGIARPSALFDFMQDAATVHAEELHLSRDKMHAIWVLSRLKMRLTRPLLAYEQLTVRTWCPGIRGATWHRSFAFSVGDEPVGGGHSLWVVLNRDTHQILRPSQFPQAEEYLKCAAGDLHQLGKLSCDTLKPHHTHRVCYSDLDVNNHVNNVKIVDFISDGLDLNLTNSFVSELQVNYSAESHFGDQIELLTSEENGMHYVWGCTEGTPRFESCLVLSPIV